MLVYQEEQKAGKKAVALLLGPLLGLLYVVLLPFISIATITAMAGRKIIGGLAGVVRGLISFGWRPSEAYLAGKRKKRKDGR